MEYEYHLRGLFDFELRSWLGRTFLNKKPKLNDGVNYLNLGCGENIIDGYINADFFRIKFWKHSAKEIQWGLDLRYSLNCENDVFDGIHTEHTIEHLYPDQAKNLLSELHRVLRKDCLIRVTVPDIEKYANYYIGNEEDIDVGEFNKRYQSRCSAIRNITQNYFHLSTWDFDELKTCMEEAGFRNVNKMSVNQSNDEKLKIDINERAWETLYVEAVK